MTAVQFPSTVEVPTVQPTQLPNLPGNGGITVTNNSSQFSADVSIFQTFPTGRAQTLAPHQSTIFPEGLPVWARVTPGQPGNPTEVQLGVWPGSPSAPQGAVDIANEITVTGTVDVGTVTGKVTVDVPGTVDIGTVTGPVTVETATGTSLDVTASGTVDVSGVSGTVDVSGSTVSITAGQVVDVQNAAGGQLTVAGAVDVGTVTGTVTIDANGSDVTVDAVGVGALLATITTGSGSFVVTPGVNTLLITSGGSIGIQPKVSFVQGTETLFVPCSVVGNSDGATQTWVAQCPVPGTYTVSDLPSGTVFIYSSTGIERVEASLIAPVVRNDLGIVVPVTLGNWLNSFNVSPTSSFPYIPSTGTTYTVFLTSEAITSVTLQADVGGTIEPQPVTCHLLGTTATTFTYGLAVLPGQSYEVTLAAAAGSSVREFAGITRADPAPLQVVSVPSPAAGADWSYTLPWPAKVVSVSGQLATSATAATRWPNLAGLLGPANTYAQYLAMTTAGVGASLYQHLQGWPGAPAPPLLNSGNPGASMFTVPPGVLPAGTTVESITFNLQAGDQWSGVVLQLEPA